MAVSKGLSREFVKFWLGQSVSLLGNQFTQLALPIAAAVTLHANAFEMGVLGALRFAPALLVGIPAGVWVDRTRRKPLLIWAQCLSAAALATIPLAALIHVLSLGQLFLVSFAAGLAATLQGIAQAAFVPTIAGRERLVEANTRIQLSLTVTNLLGPGLAGAAIQLLTAPIAIAFDALSFVVGAATSAWARVEEAMPGSAGRRHVTDAVEGQSWLWRQPLVRAITLTILLSNGGINMTLAVIVLYFVTQVGVTPAQLGLVFATGGVSSLLGARVAGPLVKRGWLGPVMAVGAALFVIGQSGWLVAAYSPRSLVLPVLLAFAVVLGCSLMVYNVNQQAIRQAVTPDRLLGRVQSGIFVLVGAAQVSGSLIGGAIGQSLGLRAAIAAGVIVCLTAALPSIFSPIRSLRQVPTLTSVTDIA
ncbi:MAG TPA: MFS transporter [Candidatus Dormibacteraeota bacterium]|nr:MFS transporter [Candidatus Dormibacteraeota bacterium]